MYFLRITFSSTQGSSINSSVSQQTTYTYILFFCVTLTATPVQELYRLMTDFSTYLCAKLGLFTDSLHLLWNSLFFDSLGRKIIILLTLELLPLLQYPKVFFIMFYKILTFFLMYLFTSCILNYSMNNKSTTVLDTKCIFLTLDLQYTAFFRQPQE